MLEASKNGKSAGYMIVSPWEVKRHGGVNGVIRNLISRMNHAERVSPFIMQNIWECPKIEWVKTSDGTFASYRLRSPVYQVGGLNNLKSVLLYFFTLPKALYVLRKIVKNNNVKIINIHYPGFNSVTFILMKILRLFKGDIVLTFHGSDLRWGLSLTGFQKFIWKAVVRKSNKITTVSKQLANQLISKNTMSESDICVIENGVDISMFSRKGARKIYQQSAPVLISIASFDYVKGTDILLKAMPKVLTRYPRIKLLLVGETGKEDEFLRKLARDLGIDSCIEWHSNVPHEKIPELLFAADAFVLTSREEGLGLALLEAGASELPVVATRVGGNPEVIDNGVNGLLVTPEDPEEVAHAVCWIFDNHEKSLDMGKNLRQRVVENFSWEVACQKYLDLL